MKEIGYWASQEQYSMKELIDFVKDAEKGDLNQHSQVIIFILGHIQMVTVILHGFGFQLPPKGQKNEIYNRRYCCCVPL